MNNPAPRVKLGGLRKEEILEMVDHALHNVKMRVGAANFHKVKWQT